MIGQAHDAKKLGEDLDEAPVDCSILVPVLDEERHILASVAAMRRQRFTGRLEFLLVDGGSTDRTRELLVELAREDQRVRVLENPRKATPSALNVGLANARGRWVARIAAHYAPRDSIGSLWRQYLQYQYGEYREKTAVRHPHTMRRSHVLAPVVVVTAVSAALAPRRMRWLARAGVGVYTAALLAAEGRAWHDAEKRSDAALAPVVLLCMHFAHGAGALRGALRHGPPLAALAEALGLAQLAVRLAPSSQTVFAPSLSTDELPRA